MAGIDIMIMELKYKFVGFQEREIKEIQDLAADKDGKLSHLLHFLQPWDEWRQRCAAAQNVIIVWNPCGMNLDDGRVDAKIKDVLGLQYEDNQATLKAANDIREAAKLFDGKTCLGLQLRVEGGGIFSRWGDKEPEPIKTILFVNAGRIKNEENGVLSKIDPIKLLLPSIFHETTHFLEENTLDWNKSLGDGGYLPRLPRQARKIRKTIYGRLLRGQM